MPQTLIAKAIGLVRRILAPVMLGAMLPVLSLLASANAEAQTEFTPPQITIHIKANIAREASRPLPSYNWRELGLRFTREQILASVTTCVEKNRLPDTETLACPDHVAQAAQPATFELDDEVSRTSKLCSLMGGDVKLEKQQEVCSNIDASGTFCFVGSREVFPCKGLYRRVLTCNSFNRPARNPFICERACEDEHFACGGGCWSGSIEPATRILPVVPRYVGEVFFVATTLKVGEARFDSLTPGFNVSMSRHSGLKYGARARVTAPSLPAGSARAATLRAEFSCPELSGEHAAHAEWSFTLTALAHPPTTTLYFESGAATGGGGKVTIDGVSPAFFSYNIVSLQNTESGEIVYPPPRPASGESRLIPVFAYPGDFVGLFFLTVQAEFRHPFHPDLGAGHCKVPEDSTPMRVNDCAASAFADCDALDDALLDSLRNSDGDKSDSDFCRALRNGADVNVFGDGDYPMALAATLNRVDIGKILLRDGATIHSGRAERGDALNYAAYAGAADFARWLIATVGASVNAQSGPGTTPIFHARTSEMVSLLIAEGASVNFVAETSPHHTTPLDAMLSDYYPDASDGDLRQAIDRLVDSGEAQCLATHANNRAAVQLCPNQVSCKEPDVSNLFPPYHSSCTLDCPDGYEASPLDCEVNFLVRGPRGELSNLWDVEKVRCEGRAKLQLSCLSH